MPGVLLSTVSVSRNATAAATWSQNESSTPLHQQTSWLLQQLAVWCGAFEETSECADAAARFISNTQNFNHITAVFQYENRATLEECTDLYHHTWWMIVCWPHWFQDGLNCVLPWISLVWRGEPAGHEQGHSMILTHKYWMLCLWCFKILRYHWRSFHRAWTLKSSLFVSFYKQLLKHALVVHFSYIPCAI